MNINPFDYLTELRRHTEGLAAKPRSGSHGITAPVWNEASQISIDRKCKSKHMVDTLNPQPA
jgi:hypothetical protein